MSYAAKYNTMLLFALLLGIAAYTAAAPAPLLALFALPAAYVGWRMTGGTAGSASKRRLPVAAVNLLLIGAVSIAGYRAAVQGFEVSHVAELVIFIQLIKLGDRRGPRDDAQILYLSVFLAIAAMLTSNTLWVGIILTIFLPVLVSAVMLFQLHKGAIAAGGGLGSPQSAGPAAPVFNRHFRRTVAFGAAGTLVAAFAVFVIMPRGIGENTLGPWGSPQRGTVTGFADRVSLGSRGVISTSPTVVLDLIVREYSADGTSLPLGSTDSVHYLRGAVLDAYDSGLWYTSRGEHKRVSRGVRLQAGEDRIIAQAGGPLIEQVITLRSTGGGDEGRRRRPSTRLFAMWRPIRVQVQRQSSLTLHYSDAIIERTGEPGPLTYTVWSTPGDGRPMMPSQRDFFEGVLDQTLEEAGEGGDDEVDENESFRRIERARTPTSFESEAIHELASEILRSVNIEPDPAVRPGSDDSRAARAIQDYLRLNFQYTLEEQYFPPEAHPIEYFLFETRRGHCEYYASAMVAMCRSVGIYARIISGYVAAEFNQASGHYTVRESNAHAWVEAEIGRNRWLRFDPTPQSDLVRIHRPHPSIFGRMRQMLDAVEFAWNSSIVGFDAGRREQLLGTSRVRDSQLVRRLDTFVSFTGLGEAKSAGGVVANLLILFVGLAVPTAGTLLLWRWLRHRRVLGKRRGTGRWQRDLTLDPPFFQSYLDALARSGHPKPLWRPPLAHAQSLPTPDLADPATGVARLYYRSRFAGCELTQGELSEADRLIGEIRSVVPPNGESRG